MAAYSALKAEKKPPQPPAGNKHQGNFPQFIQLWDVLNNLLPYGGLCVHHDDATAAAICVRSLTCLYAAAIRTHEITVLHPNSLPR